MRSRGLNSRRLRRLFPPRLVSSLLSLSMAVAYSALLLSTLTHPVFLSPGQSLAVQHPLQRDPEKLLDIALPPALILPATQNDTYESLPMESETIDSQPPVGTEDGGEALTTDERDQVIAATISWNIPISVSVSISFPFGHVFEDCTYFVILNDGWVPLDMSNVNAFIPAHCGYRVPTPADLEFQAKSQIDSDFRSNQAGPAPTERADHSEIERIVWTRISRPA